MKIELLEQAMFEQIAKPEQIGGRAIKLQKILLCFRSIACLLVALRLSAWSY